MRRLRWCGWLLAAALPAHGAELRTLIGSWDYGIGGVVVDGGQQLDLERDLAAEPEGTGSGLLEYDGAGGWWPDWALRYERIGGAGRQTQSLPFSFGNLELPLGATDTTVSTAVDFDDVDLVLRYPLGGARLNGALGIAAKWLRGEVVLADGNGGRTRHAYDELFPELHGQLRWHPHRWAALAAAVQGIRIGDDRALEWRAALELRALPPLLIELGWQEKQYAMGVADHALDARLDGALLRFGLVLPVGPPRR